MCDKESRTSSTDHRGPITTIPLCSFWDQQLHIWEFLESLGSHGNIVLSGLQLSSWGHGCSPQRAQPDEAQGFSFTRWISLSLCSYVTVSCHWPAHSSSSQADLLCDQAQDLLQVLPHALRNDESEWWTQEISISENTEKIVANKTCSYACGYCPMATVRCSPSVIPM